MDIKQINPEDTYEIRHKVLRPDQPLETCQYEEDHLPGAFHLGVFHEGDLVSIASFYQERHPSFEDEVQYRLRGMATLEEYRRKKFGSSLLRHAEEILKKKNTGLLWCNARVPVSDYYTNFGFRESGKVFVSHSTGAHIVMYKIL